MFSFGLVLLGQPSRASKAPFFSLDPALVAMLAALTVGAGGMWPPSTRRAASWPAGGGLSGLLTTRRVR